MTDQRPEIVLLKLPEQGQDLSRRLVRRSSCEGGSGEAAKAEQFVMIDRDELFPTRGPVSREQWMEHFAQLLQQPPLSEAAVREALLRRGLSARDIDDQLAAARRKYLVMTSKPTSWEHITRVGYRNPDGQQIVRKTDAGGPQGQRIFVLRCTVCDHEYGAYGIDADIRRCPVCQEGPPGLPVPPE
jgi:hypothetical protein